MKKQKITKDDNQKMTYASSGVNIEKANDLIEEIKPIIKNTKISNKKITRKKKS